jgi:hypothetical protein
VAGGDRAHYVPTPPAGVRHRRLAVGGTVA